MPESDTFAMPTKAKQAIRSKRLALYIKQKYKGRASAFIEHSGINQGEVSQLLSGKKSFGEKKARSIEEIEELPEGWLDDALPDEGTQAVMLAYQHLRPDYRDELAHFAEYLLSKQSRDEGLPNGDEDDPLPLRPKPN